MDEVSRELRSVIDHNDEFGIGGGGDLALIVM